MSELNWIELAKDVAADEMAVAYQWHEGVRSLALRLWKQDRSTAAGRLAVGLKKLTQRELRKIRADGHAGMIAHLFKAQIQAIDMKRWVKVAGFIVEDVAWEHEHDWF